jgi:5-methylcytosine-specific restriction endonuclease McrA
MPAKSLSKLSDKELLNRVTTLVRHERETTLSILLHLNEVYRRRLYLGLGYRSLFDYCVRHLGYSRSAAGRRFQTARCIREFPEVYRMLETGEANLSTITLVASVLSHENKTDILDRIRGKSQEEVEAIAAGYRPPVPQRDRVKPVSVVVPKKIHPDTGALALNQSRSGTNSSFAPPGSGSETAGASSPAEAPTEPTTHQKLMIQFIASNEFMAKYEAVCALLPHNSRLSFESVFETLLDGYLERHSPEKCAQRRKNRQANARAKTTNPKASVPKDTKTTKPSRHIPAAVRDKVFIRDKGRCTYKGPDGERCGATRALQIDHIRPYARGGPHALSNLRLLCAHHNRHEAENAFGKDLMRRYRKRE